MFCGRVTPCDGNRNGLVATNVYDKTEQRVNEIKPAHCIGWSNVSQEHRVVYGKAALTLHELHEGGMNSAMYQRFEKFISFSS